jgi:hypothetical protein
MESMVEGFKITLMEIWALGVPSIGAFGILLPGRDGISAAPGPGDPPISLTSQDCYKTAGKGAGPKAQ